MRLFLHLSSILLGRYCRKNFAKSGGFRKKIKKGYGYVRGLKPSAYYEIIREKQEIFQFISMK